VTVHVPNSRTVVTVTDGSAPVVWTVTGAAPPRRAGELTGSKGRTVLLWTAGGATVAVLDLDGRLTFWDLNRRRPIGLELRTGSGPVRSAALSSDGSALAVADNGGTVTLWDVTAPDRRQGRILSAYGPVTAMAYSADERTLAVAADGAVTLWDVARPGRPQRIAQPATGFRHGVGAVAFTGADRFLTTVGATGAAARWDLSTLRDLRTEAVTRACAYTGGGLDAAGWRAGVDLIPYTRTCTS
jgi:WD40 repeat protein